MIPERVQHRRGEAVVLSFEDGTERLGTIEFGDETTTVISIYCEKGGRVILRRLDYGFPKMRPDPGGLRPVWDSVSKVGQSR
jgi:hypothetical protein